jgi:hypothetical protein
VAFGLPAHFVVVVRTSAKRRVEHGREPGRPALYPVATSGYAKSGTTQRRH